MHYMHPVKSRESIMHAYHKFGVRSFSLDAQEELTKIEEMTHHAQDLATACLQSLSCNGSNLFHVGSDNVVSLRSVYEAVIRAAGSRSRVASLPKGPTIAAMQLAHKLNLSPLGPYHYRMIAESFVFDTTRIRTQLGWTPTVTNEEMMIRAYQYYAENRKEIHARTDVSAHSRPTSMGIIRMLKWFS